MRSRRGIALLVVLGILGVMFVLAVTFTTLARLERQASQQRIHATRAFLLARSGIEDALSRLASGQDPWILPNRPVAIGRPAFGTGDGRHSGRLSDPPATGHYALSLEGGGFHVNGGDPAQPSGEGYNAVLARVLATLADAIDRESGPPAGILTGQDGLNLVALRPREGWKSFEEIRTVALDGSHPKLEALKPYLTLRAMPDLKVIRPNAEAAREGERPKAWAEIRRRPPLDFERMPDGRVVGRAPVDLAWARHSLPALLALISGLKGQYLSEYDARPQGDPLGGQDLDCTGSLKSVEILPADAQTVALRIRASTDPLETWEAWDRFCDTLDFPAATAGLAPEADRAVAEAQAARDRLEQAAMEALWNDPDGVDGQEYGRARYAADQAAANLVQLQRRRAEGWDQELLQACRALLKANFNPNTDLNKFNPNDAQWRILDKSDLLISSTEFSLRPIGALRMASLGRVLEPSGRLLASRMLEAELEGPLVLRLTTQGEFVASDLGNLDLAGDEKGFRMPGDALYLGRSRGTLRTWGKAFLPDPLVQGLSLQSYPEPYTLGPEIRPASYDGSLQLATVETAKDATYGQATGPLLSLARFDDDYDLDAAAGAPGCLPGDSLACGADRTRSVLDPARPGTLYPDGAYSERQREPAYAGAGNFPPRRGLLSFWVKPNYNLSRAPLTSPAHPNIRRGHLYFLATRWNGNGFPIISPYTQTFLVAHAVEAFGQEVVGGFFEIMADNEDFCREHQFSAPASSLPARQWRLCTFSWDFEEDHPTSPDGTGEFVLDSDRKGSQEAYTQSTLNRPSDAQDLTGAGGFAFSPARLPHRIVLGSRLSENEAVASWLRWGCCGSGADATIDEFAVWRCPRDPDNLLAGSLASARYSDGRYYAETAWPAAGLGIPEGADADGDGLPDRRAPEWFSAPLSLPSGAVLREIAWTLSPSRGWRLDVSLARTDGTGYVRGLQSPFRIHAAFRRDAPPESPLLDTPRLDDISLTWTPREGRRILSWTSGRGVS